MDLAEEAFRDIRRGNVAGVIEALKRGLDPNSRNSMRQTLLHMTARMQDSSTLIQALVERGANLEDRDLYGWTAVHNAAIFSSAESLACLAECGADLEPRDRNGKSALHHAAQGADFPTTEQLLELGASRDVRTKNNRLAMEYFTLPRLRDLLRPIHQLINDHRARIETTRIAKPEIDPPH